VYTSTPKNEYCRLPRSPRPAHLGLEGHAYIPDIGHNLQEPPWCYRRRARQGFARLSATYINRAPSNLRVKDRA